MATETAAKYWLLTFEETTLRGSRTVYNEVSDTDPATQLAEKWRHALEEDAAGRGRRSVVLLFAMEISADRATALEPLLE